MAQSSSQDDNPATAQIAILFLSLFVIGSIIIGQPAHQPQAITETQITPTPTADPNIISNPQIDESEVAATDSQAPAMPVSMFNLENPNGWDTPESVTLVGSFQNEVGCEADDMLDCPQTEMTYDILGDIWQVELELPPGEYQYRAYLDHSETKLYGQHGISGIHSFPIELTLDTEQTVHFYYDHKTGWITDDINSLILTLPSNFQDDIGCREEWNAGCFRTWMQDLEGDGIYTFETLLVPGGSWETRVALNGNIDTSYGQDGTFDGENIPLWIPNIGHLTVFTWDSNLKTLTTFVSNVPIRLSTDLPPIAPNH